MADAIDLLTTPDTVDPPDMQPEWPTLGHSAMDAYDHATKYGTHYESYNALIDAYFYTIDQLKDRVETTLIRDVARRDWDSPVAFPVTRDGKVWRVVVEQYEDFFLREDIIENATVTTLVPPHTTKNKYGHNPVEWRVSGTGRLGEYRNIPVWLPDGNDDRFWGTEFEVFGDVKEALKK